MGPFLFLPLRLSHPSLSISIRHLETQSRSQKPRAEGSVLVVLTMVDFLLKSGTTYGDELDEDPSSREVLFYMGGSLLHGRFSS